MIESHDTAGSHKVSTSIPTGALEAAGPALRRKVTAERDGHDLELDAAEQQKIDTALAMLEIGFLVAAADGELTEDELASLGDHFASWFDQDLSRDEMADVLADFAEALEAEGYEACLRQAADRLPRDAARGAYAIACAVSAADAEVAQDEADALGDIAEELGIPEEEAARIFEGVVAQISAAASA